MNGGRKEMFSTEEKRLIAGKLEELLLSLNHPEMPTAKARFTLHVDGAESWSWADIVPNWTFDEVASRVEMDDQKVQDLIEAGRPIAGDAVTDAAKKFLREKP
jgi:hypothetical protein